MINDCKDNRSAFLPDGKIAESVISAKRATR